MKTLSKLAAAAALAWFSSVCPALAAPGTIGMRVAPPGPISLCDTVTVTFAIGGYTDATEVDGFNFRVNYNPARFSLVPGSFALHDVAAPDPNWLRLSAQEAGAGSILDDFTNISVPGVVDASVADMRLAPNVLSPRGTTGGAGFLYSFQLAATTAGTGGITLQPAAGGVVLHDAFLAPAGVPLFDTASFNVTIVGPELTIVRLPGPVNQVRITWNKGTLLGTATLGTAFAPVAGATSPYTTTASGAQRFFRVVVP